MEENLRGLEALLCEFFDERTNNDRKRAIEALLEGFQSSKGAWKEASYFMTHTRNQYVCMFAINTLESIIHKQWVVLQVSDKSEIRSIITGILKEHNQSTPPFIRNKLIKLLVDIARTDWPHFYPEFFIKNIYESLEQKKTLVLGLSTLLIASEELATPREENVYTLRRQELRKLMNEQVPRILRTLHNILLKVLSGKGSRNTPPPSPSHRPHAIKTFAPLKSSKENNNLNPLSYEEDENEIVELALKCLAHLFSWISLSSVSLDLTDVLFRYARQSVGNLGCYAMNCINEVVYCQFVPDNYQNFFLHIFKNAFSLLSDLMNGDPTNGLVAFDEVYLEKFTELLRNFVHIHIRRFYSNPEFPMMDFLSLLFKYSFQQPYLEGFFSCLEVWGLFIDFVGSSPSRVSHGSPTKAFMKFYSNINSSDNPYAPPLMALVRDILKKISFKFNESELSSLNNIVIDDDNKTEWQNFLFHCIEILMKVASNFPNEVFQLLDEGWKEYSSVYLQLTKYIVNSSFVLPSEVEYRQLHCVLRDFSTYLQIMGRISSFTIGEHFNSQLNIAGSYMKQLIELVSFGSQYKLYLLNSPFPALSEDFMDVHAQSLAALKTWCHWLAQLHREAIKEPQQFDSHCRELTSSMVISVIPVIKSGSNDKLMHAVAHFLVTLTGTVRPPSIWKLKEFTELFSDLPRLKLLPDAERLMVRALSNVLLLTWPGISDQRWDEREKHLKKFLGEITINFGKLSSTDIITVKDAAKPVIIHALRILGDLVEHILNEVTQSKKLIHDCIKESINISFSLFPLYLDDATLTESLLSFFLIIFDVLKAQMGHEYVEKSIQNLLSVFNQEQLNHILSTDEGSGLKVVEKFLQILQFVVKEPDSSFRKFIPLTLSLCLDHICPLVIDKPSSDLKTPLYSLLFETLFNNWQYFFKSSVVRCLAVAGHSKINNNDLKDQNKELFHRVMEAFGRSFLQPDISVFKQNLLNLEKLHNKWKLYEKEVFMESLITQFLTVLLQVLIHRSHDLLREEIITAVYNMASVDFNAFFSGFLQVFLSGMEGLNDQQRDTLKNNFKCDSK
ncbi:exportin-6-A isoform X2 [Lepeophtheirus salmonis]|uniref:exportin-6-A isoform X2 n=1 Tax=Lepeophtheirus salmonis TaxID=72036 RepID=UPI003AF35149